MEPIISLEENTGTWSVYISCDGQIFYFKMLSCVTDKGFSSTCIYGPYGGQFPMFFLAGIEFCSYDDSTLFVL